MSRRNRLVLHKRAASLRRTSTKRRQNMSIAIERLRVSKQKIDQEERTNGHTDGRKWAENDAEYAWLRRLADNSGSTYPPLVRLFRAIDPRDELDRSELCQRCFGDDVPASEESYTKGFVEGAVELFEEVRDQI